MAKEPIRFFKVLERYRIKSFSDPSVRYQIIYGSGIREGFKAFYWQCECPAFQFQLGDCKHIIKLKKYLEIKKHGKDQTTEEID